MKIFTTILFLTLVNLLLGQQANLYLSKMSYIIKKKDKEKLYGAITLKKNEFHIKFKNDRISKKFRADKLLEFKKGKYTYKTKIINELPCFAKLIEKGKINLYYHKFKYYVEKEDILYGPIGVKFSKTISDFIKDYVFLASLVESKHLTIPDIEFIIKEYNKWSTNPKKSENSLRKKFNNNRFNNGYIITLNNDTIRGRVFYNELFKVNAISTPNLQSGINYAPLKVKEHPLHKIKVETDEGKRRYKSRNIKGYEINGRTFRVFKTPFWERKIFMEVINDGPIQLLCYKKEYYTNIAGDQFGGMGTPTSFNSGINIVYCIVKDDKLKHIYKSNFEKTIIPYIEDYKELKNFIEEGYLDFDDIETIIEVYNENKLK